MIATKAKITAPPKVSELLLGAPLSAVLATFCLVMLAGWLPHYLTWPWWIDIDALAAVAQEWDVGLLPYRDVAVFNFPGQIELLWLLGTSFGWGRTSPVYAADAALLLTLGLVMAAWSLRCLGRCSPGLVGYIAVLHYYLGLDYALVAQRDWHAPLLVVLGMMLVQAWPSWATSVGSGLLFGLALVIRPHVLLFAPAVAFVVAVSTLTDPMSSAPLVGARREVACCLRGLEPRAWEWPWASLRWSRKDCLAILCGGCGRRVKAAMANFRPAQYGH